MNCVFIYLFMCSAVLFLFCRSDFIGGVYGWSPERHEGDGAAFTRPAAHSTGFQRPEYKIHKAYHESSVLKKKKKYIIVILNMIGIIIRCKMTA